MSTTHRIGDYHVPLSPPASAAEALELAALLDELPGHVAFAAAVLTCWRAAGGMASGDPDPQGAIPSTAAPSVHYRPGKMAEYGAAAFDALLRVGPVEDIQDAGMAAIGLVTDRVRAIPRREKGNG
jgi:hypothetical protein